MTGWSPRFDERLVKVARCRFGSVASPRRRVPASAACRRCSRSRRRTRGSGPWGRWRSRRRTGPGRCGGRCRSNSTRRGRRADVLADEHAAGPGGRPHRPGVGGRALGRDDELARLGRRRTPQPVSFCPILTQSPHGWSGTGRGPGRGTRCGAGDLSLPPLWFERQTRLEPGEDPVPDHRVGRERRVEGTVLAADLGRVVGSGARSSGRRRGSSPRASRRSSRGSAPAALGVEAGLTAVAADRLEPAPACAVTVEGPGAVVLGAAHAPPWPGRAGCRTATGTGWWSPSLIAFTDFGTPGGARGT